MVSSSNVDNSAFPPPDIHEADRLYDSLQKLEQQLNQAFMGNKKAVRLLLTAFVASGFPLLEGATGTGRSFLLSLLAQEMGINVDFISPISHRLLEHSGNHIKQGNLFPLIEDTLFVASNVFFLSEEMRLEFAQKLHNFSSHFPIVRPKTPSCIFLAGTQDTNFNTPMPAMNYSLLDGFMLTIPFFYLPADMEKEIMLTTTGVATEKKGKHHYLSSLVKARDFIRRMPIGESIVAKILELIRSLRPQLSLDPEIKSHIATGPGTKAAQDFVMAIRAYALLDGRLTPEIQDVAALAVPLLRHRIIPKDQNKNPTFSVENYLKRQVQKL